ncbi:MAG: hypothetical protein AAF436_13005, partial [Myxococcota bacterium]
MRRSFLSCVWVLVLGLVFAGCSDGESTPEPEPGEITYPLLDCDPLVPEFCSFPFPSNVYAVDDDTTPTGRRVSFG